MLKKLLTLFRFYDWYLIINTVLLMIFSLAILYSLQINVAEPSFVIFNRQLIFIIVGLILFFLISLINYQFWSDYYKVIFFIVALLLITVLFIGVSIRGTTGWLEFFGQTFQPVELAKIALIIFLAKFISLHAKHSHLTRDIIVSGLLAGILIVLVMLQPDLGSAMLLFLTWLGMILILPIKRRTLIAILIIILLISSIFWLFIFKDYQKDRLLTFLQPQRDPLGAGYNVRQAVVAIGSGHLFGRGLGLGSQSQLNFLPEQQTDFIFAVIAEELGFVGAGLLLVLFLSLLIKIYKIAKKTADNFGQLFILGAIISLVVQISINIGMNLGIAPVAGVPLPLISYGGSSLISVLIILGMVHSIHIRNRSSLFGGKE